MLVHLLQVGTLEAGTPFGLAWRRRTSEFLLDEQRRRTRWHRRFTSPGLNWHFDPFKILIVCVYSLPCCFGFRNDLTVFLTRTLKIRPVGSVIKVSTMLACVLQSHMSLFLSLDEGGKLPPP